jgi:hypothetical protein
MTKIHKTKVGVFTELWGFPTSAAVGSHKLGQVGGRTSAPGRRLRGKPRNEVRVGDSSFPYAESCWTVGLASRCVGTVARMIVVR